ncbi:MAG: (2Fe-2S)-binding protein [Kutzneria sp.]|nr:(2Fe-2S)-binding protein [Kutzneria sp.]
MADTEKERRHPVTERIMTADSLADPDMLGEMVDAAGRQWATGDSRVAGTLWWYMASFVLFTPLAARLAAGDPPPDPALCRTRLSVGDGGQLLSAQPMAWLSDMDSLADGLRRSIGAIVDTLAGVAEMRPRPLWAVAADSLANALLGAWREQGAAGRGVTSARRLAEAIGVPMPMPRFVEVAIDGRTQPVPLVRRISCCLIYQVGAATCASCPRQPPEGRRRRMTEAAQLL